MHRAQEQVRDFHRACKLPRPEGLNLTLFRKDNEERALRERLLLEELDELGEAQSIDEVLQELCDVLYHVYGYAVTLGVDLQPYFEEVHRANMEKAGGPQREDGKQLKPEGWRPPNIGEILMREK